MWQVLLEVQVQPEQLEQLVLPVQLALLELLVKLDHQAPLAQPVLQVFPDQLEQPEVPVLLVLQVQQECKDQQEAQGQQE